MRTDDVLEALLGSVTLVGFVELMNVLSLVGVGIARDERGLFTLTRVESKTLAAKLVESAFFELSYPDGSSRVVSVDENDGGIDIEGAVELSWSTSTFLLTLGGDTKACPTREDVLAMLASHGETARDEDSV